MIRVVETMRMLDATVISPPKNLKWHSVANSQFRFFCMGIEINPSLVFNLNIKLCFCTCLLSISTTLVILIQLVFKLLIFISGDIDPNNVFQAFFGDQMGQPGFNFGGNQFPGGGFSFHFQWAVGFINPSCMSYLYSTVNVHYTNLIKCFIISF